MVAKSQSSKAGQSRLASHLRLTETKPCGTYSRYSTNYLCSPHKPETVEPAFY